MKKEDWLKAIALSKDKLIEWLNEMYESEAELNSIISQYEKHCNIKGIIRKKQNLKGETVWVEEFEVSPVFKYCKASK